ncbi:MAG TPA: hypothetical protein VIM69_09545, partial [Opitutaceae bacterium]
MRKSFCCICTAFFCAFQHANAADLLTLEAKIPLPGVGGRIDHFSFDERGHRIFVAALGNNSVEVVDVVAKKVVKSLSGFSEPQGIQYVEQTQ